MAFPNRPTISPALALGGLLLAACGTGILAPDTAAAQEVPALRLGGVLPGGVRASATESWGAYDFTLTNLSDTDRVGRVFLRFEGRPDVLYGREVWVPARSSLASWMLVGPAVPQGERLAANIETLLFDQTAGKEDLIRPRSEERIRSRGVLYRRREPSTAILLDNEVPAAAPWGQLPQVDSRTDEAILLARALRSSHKLSELVHRIPPGPLPPLPEAFGGIDHFVLASGRIAQDPAGMQTLRRWLEQGGKVWVMLDMVEPELLGPLLGDAFDFQVVDRVNLTSFVVQTHPAGSGVPDPPPQQHDRPVDFVRVLLPSGEQAKHTINGWPAWFSRSVGRGEVVLTTLGPRGWFRPRTPRDPPSPYQYLQSFPVPNAPLLDVAIRLQPPPDDTTFRDESFQPLLTEEIGYAVPRRLTVLAIFGGFLTAALAVGIALRKSRWREMMGWLGPAAALGAAGVFLGMAEVSRRAAPPTVAVAQVVDAVAGQEEATVHGLLAEYRPDSGPARAGVQRGGFFELDTSGIEGQTRRLVLTDADAWHWENLALPAGVRRAAFHGTAAIDTPMTAVARFGADGVEGKLTGPFEDLADALLTTPNGRNLAVQIRPDGTFRAAAGDILPKGQFLAGAVLSDRQQRRQEIYRAFLKRSGSAVSQGRTALLAWASPLDMHFVLDPDVRTVGSALLVAPLRLERPAAGTRITIPGPFLLRQRMMNGLPARAALESGASIDMHLRFQLPAEVLPFQVERARLSLRIDAPSRRVTIEGRTADRTQELVRVESPLDPIRLDIAEANLLRLDDEGGIHLNLNVSEPLKGGSARSSSRQLVEKWTIEHLELEVVGRPEG
jgi:hypothetical protein